MILTGQNQPTLDTGEIDRFARLADKWWDPEGEFRPLHKLGPARLAFLRSHLVRHFNREEHAAKPLTGLTILDVGCGGGLISEPLARLGAIVTGIDPAEENIAVAIQHAEPQGLAIHYRACRVEELVAEHAQFDAIVCLEVVEHVPDPQAFITTCAEVLRPGGLFILSTINRTLKSYALAIVGAEYILRWLPIGTHQWDRFITPEELSRYCISAGLQQPTFEGLIYNPLTGRWTLGADTDVNYMAAAAKPAPGSH
ncbi:MAG: bifunctional 2-polyprenyl-6-hydroxyphenol methylase/3-demethylubiquinol 3-O-methyltransferase UbiG [Proteobacteria bacterium]|jgi:ubiquinone biosynthesis O-methyltransferase|nr:MAG: bifunctional 2-polyprenyl-6-hydroxyphenol methylase/3-demethylubiquinol 3-O-methyltransferase UbiG [Pseudomonadota bacterium]